MKVFFLRHGESVDDIEDSYGGIADFPLTDDGRKTAHELAKRLSDTGIQVVFSSPYRRAKETADIVAQALGCDVTVHDDLRERNSYGVLSGVNKAKAKEIFSSVFGKLTGKPGDYYSTELVIGAEPKEEFDARVKAAVNSILENARQYEKIAVVTHGNFTRSLYSNILDVPGKVDLELLAITVVEHENEKLKLENSEGVTVSPG